MGLFDFLKPKPKPQPTPEPTPNPTPEVAVALQMSTPDSRDSEDFDELWKRANSLPVSNGGLFPYEILMLSYAPKYAMERPDFPRFWLYKFGIRNPADVLSSLLKRGFLREGTWTESLDSLKVSDLKTLLSDCGEKVSGKKAELIERVVQCVSEEELKKRGIPRRYALTDAGKRELAENEYVVYLHYNGKNYDISMSELSALVRQNPGRPFRDLIWSELNRKLGEYESAGQWGLSRNCYYSMAKLLEEEGRYSDALVTMAEVAYYDVNICGIGSEYKKTEVANMRAIPPGISECLKAYRKKCDISDNALFNELAERFRFIERDGAILSPLDTAGLIVAEINGDEATVRKVYQSISM